MRPPTLIGAIHVYVRFARSFLGSKTPWGIQPLFVDLLLSWQHNLRGSLSLTSFYFIMGPSRPLSTYSHLQFHQVQTCEQLEDPVEPLETGKYHDPILILRFGKRARKVATQPRPQTALPEPDSS